MAKKNNTRNFNTRYNRYEKSNNKDKDVRENLTYTQQQAFHFEELEDLDSTRNLDISFVDGKKNMKKIKTMVDEEVETLDTDEVKKANLEFNTPMNAKKKSRYIAIIFVLGLLCIILLAFTIFHFSTVDHNKRTIFKEVIKEVKVVDDNYVFLGDSITEFYDLERYYEKLPVINSGISGYTTDQILDHLDKMVYQYNPSKVFLLIGINDLEKEVDNEKIADNIKKIISNIKKNRPYSKIYLESIYPINNSNDEKIAPYVINGNRNNEDVLLINEMLVDIAKEEDLTYIDLYSELVGEDGLLRLDYTNDGLHISDKGYEVITDIINRYIDK